MRPRHLVRGAGRSGLLLLFPAVALATLAAGCGGSSSTASSATTIPAAAAGSAASRAAARAKFTTCLEAHGVPASEATRGFRFGRRSGAGSSSGAATPPSTATPPTTSAGFAAAFQACRSDLPGGFGRRGFVNSAAGKAYLQCLQLHGVTIPTTPSGTANGGAPGGRGLGSLASNPKFQAARTACAALAPRRSRPGGGPGTTSTTAAP